MLLLPLYPTLQFPKIPRSPQIPSGLCRHIHPQPKHGNLTPRTYPPSLSIPFLPIYITPIIQFENNYLVFILYEVSNSGFKKRGGWCRPCSLQILRLASCSQDPRRSQSNRNTPTAQRAEQGNSSCRAYTAHVSALCT
jgi:hypothetical protein